MAVGPMREYAIIEHAQNLERELIVTTERANRTVRAYLCNQGMPEADAEAEANRVYPLC